MATTRRGSGEGSVYQRGDGRWVAQVESGRHPNGRRRYARAVRGDKKAALRALGDLQRGAEMGVHSDRSTTVDAFLDAWLENVLPQSGVKESTALDYREVLQRWVRPHVGRRRLASLTPNDVRSMLTALEKQGLSPRTRQYARAVLRRALKTAVSDGLIARNPAALVDGPRNASTKLDDALTPADVRTVLDVAEGEPLEALAILALHLGLRRGEALALRWENVDLDGGEIRIEGTLKVRPGGELYIDPPKTAAARRTVPLIGRTADALRQHRRRQVEAQLAAGNLWHDSGYVFTRMDGRAVIPDAASAWWRDLTERSGIGRRRFHATRHTAATIMLEDGVPLEVVSAILGHAGLAITADVYARVTADSKRRALVNLQGQLGGTS